MMRESGVVVSSGLGSHIEIGELMPGDDVGAGVVYVPKFGKREDGVITSWNDTYIFVRFRGSETPKACDPRDLEWP